jgi:hypothetical protein
MLLRPRQLELLEHLCTSNPEQLISYTYDRVNDVAVPISFSPLPRSGRLYSMESRELLEKCSRMELSSCLPRMLNSIAPRSHLDAMIRRFGSVFASMSPDFCFCYRSLVVATSILYLDKSILLNYAQSRSNGGSVSRGVKSKDYNDYLANMSGEKECHLCPLPNVITIGNGVTHEYCYVSSEAGAGVLPDLNLQNYRTYLANEVFGFVDPVQRAAAIEVLEEDGWKKPALFIVRKAVGNFLKGIFAVCHPRFSSLEDCLEYAKNKSPIELPWLLFFVRRYGRKVIRY